MEWTRPDHRAHHDCSRTPCDTWDAGDDLPIAYAHYLRKQNLETPDPVESNLDEVRIPMVSDIGEPLKPTSESSAANLGDVSEGRPRQPESEAPIQAVRRAQRVQAPIGALIDIII